MSDSYQDFLAGKALTSEVVGFDCDEESMPEMMYPFQKACVKWALKRGRAALFELTGLGKTVQQVEWARQVAAHAGGNILILAPLCVAQQTVHEAAKFGVEVRYCRTQSDVRPGITITNYERLAAFDPGGFVGVVGDELSIIKHATSKTRGAVIDAFRDTPYRLSCTATPAPNDHMELGSQCEFLGIMSAAEMLAMFFTHDGGSTANWRLKGHAKTRFWEWMSTWSICINSPADLGFDGSAYVLPDMLMHEHVVDAEFVPEGQLFATVAQTLTERREAKKASMNDRCAKVYDIVSSIFSDKLSDIIRSRNCDGLATETCGVETTEGKDRSGVSIKEDGAREGEGRNCEKEIHARVPKKESRKVQAEPRKTSAIQSEETGEIRSRQGISGFYKDESRGMAIKQPDRKETTETSCIRDNAREIQRIDGQREPSMSDMRVFGHERSEDVSCCGPLSQYQQSARDALHELQYGDWETSRFHRTLGSRDSILEKLPKFIIWCHLNDEQKLLGDSLSGLCVSVTGTDSIEKKEQDGYEFSSGATPIIISKPSIFGHGMNWQHCHNMAFVGLNDSFEQFYQAIRRCHRFGQRHAVNVHVISSEAEGAVRENLARKQTQADEMSASMVSHMRELTRSQIKGATVEKSDYTRSVAEKNDWALHLGDCVDVVSQLADHSIDYTIFSPPFSSLYTYSNSDRDMGNSRNDGQFYDHFRFLVVELLRVTKPGRLLSFHCMNMQTLKSRDGFIGIKDFRGELIRMFQDAGWIFHSEVCIWKDPVTAMQRTKAIGLLYKQLRKDSTLSRQGIPDYLVTMRAPGDNAERVTKTHDGFPVDLWQRYASPVWMDINPSKTLQYRSARENDDERHIAPLQLDVIERAIELWTNPRDLVLSPFAGIGSEGYVALQMNRRFIGAELKRSYWECARRNLDAAAKQMSLDLTG